MVLLGRGRFRETKSALHRNKHVLLVAKATLLLLTRDRTLHPLLRFLSPLALLTLLCRAAFRVLPSPPAPRCPARETASAQDFTRTISCSQPSSMPFPSCTHPSFSRWCCEAVCVCVCVCACACTCMYACDSVRVGLFVPRQSRAPGACADASVSVPCAYVHTIISAPCTQARAGKPCHIVRTSSGCSRALLRCKTALGFSLEG